MSDAASNFAKTTVIGDYDAVATAIEVSSSIHFPATPFNATWWNSTDYSDPSDDPSAEIVRVLGITSAPLGDGTSVISFYLTRAQEGTTATVKNLANKVYRIMAGLTAKMWNDLAGTASGALPGDVPRFIFVSGNPEGVVTATAPTFGWDVTTKFLYVKETGTGNTGWSQH